MPPGGYHFIRVPRNRHAGQRTRQVTWKSDAGLIMALLDFLTRLVLSLELHLSIYSMRFVRSD